MRAVHDGDLTAFVRGLQREPWLLGEFDSRVTGLFPSENRRPAGGSERVDRLAMAPLGLGEQAREFRLAFERLERGFPIEVREARKTLIDGASEGRRARPPAVSSTSRRSRRR